MNERLQIALAARLTALADDELILAHRNSEWTGIAPILEEDIALANIAQDELGHATVYFNLLKELTGDDPDQMAFFRSAPDFRNVQMVELPKGDWAFTMLRQYLFDLYENVLLSALAESRYQPLADATAKIRQEEIYHLRHSHAWVERLGLGTEESNRRMQDALDLLWPHTDALFAPMPSDRWLIDEGCLPDLQPLHSQWEEIARLHLEASELVIPPNNSPTLGNREEHTIHLSALLQEMQQVARWDPQAEW